MKSKKILRVVAISGMLLALCACNASQPNSDTSTDANSPSSSNVNAFSVATATKQENSTAISSSTLESQKPDEPTFDEANIMSFSIANRDDDSYKDIIATIIATNNGMLPVDYLSIDVSYLDAAGNELCDDGRFHNCQMESGKTAIFHSYSDLDDKPKSDVAEIIVTGYTYYIGNFHYSVNLRSSKVKFAESNSDANADFESVNIVSFNIIDKGPDGSDSYDLEVQIKNDGSIPIVYSNYDMAYFDKDMNCLDTDGRFSDAYINSGNFATSKSYCTDEDVVADVSFFGVFKYCYELESPDSNGFNYYRVNLQTKTATGKLKD